MGHYDDSYDAENSRIASHNRNGEMSAKRKISNDIQRLLDQSYGCRYQVTVPERFVHSLEDFKRWANEGLVEHEREQVIKKLKGE